MPAKTEISAEEWFYHSLFVDMEQGFTFELADIVVIFVSWMALNGKKKERDVCWDQSSLKKHILHACKLLKSSWLKLSNLGVNTLLDH